MRSKPLNRSLRAAKATKQDEFYTQLSDIEKELREGPSRMKPSKSPLSATAVWVRGSSRKDLLQSNG
jgi:hypothetical protein